MAETRLQAVRRQLGYKADEVIRMLFRRADELGVSVMSATSLKVKLSRWENGHEAVSQVFSLADRLIATLFPDLTGSRGRQLLALLNQPPSSS